MSTLRAVIYCRCSTEEESQVDALAKQVIEAKEAVKRNHWLLVDSFVESRSGTTAEGRREYLRLFDQMQSDQFDVIVIKSQDRLMRNTKDWYVFIERMQKNGKQLYLYLENKFYSPEDALISGIKAIMAEEYSRELSKKINNAHRHRQKNGGRMMLTNKTYALKKEPDGSVTVIEEQAEVVREIYRLCAAGYGSRVIANLLQEKGIRSKNGLFMTETTVRRILRNPLYKGDMILNRTHFDFDTKSLIHNPEDQWIYAEHVAPAIVDEALWARANAAMDERAAAKHQNGRYPKGSNPGKYNLSGILICGCCGKPYYRTWRRGYRDPEEIVYEWKCSAYINIGRKNHNRRDSQRKTSRLLADEQGCDNIHLREDVVYQLLEQLSGRYYQIQLQEKESIIQKTIQLLERVMSRNPSEQKCRDLKTERESVRKKKQLLLEKLLAGIVTDADYQVMNRQLESRLQEIEGQLEKLQKGEQERKNIAGRLEQIKARLEQGGVEKATAGQMLRNVEHIIVHEWQLEVCFNPLHIAGISNVEKAALSQILGKEQDQVRVFLDYPFDPATERGRMLDRKMVSDILREEPAMTAKKIAQKMGRTTGVIITRMNELRRDGYIQYQPKGKHGYWLTLKEYPDPRTQKVAG